MVWEIRENRRKSNAIQNTPETGDKISVIGIGTGPIFEAPEKEAVTALTYAYEQGINYADFATAGAKTFFLRRKSVWFDTRRDALSDPFRGQLRNR